MAGALSEDTVTVAPSPRSVRSLSFDVTKIEDLPCLWARWNMVSAKMYSPDSMYISWPVSRTRR